MYIITTLLAVFSFILFAANPESVIAGTWTEVGPPSVEIVSLAQDPVNPDVLYVGASNMGLYKSTDGGNTWGMGGNPNNYFWHITIDPITNSTLYVNFVSAGIYKSTNAGETWVEINNGLLPQDNYNQSYAVTINPSSPSILYIDYHSSSGGSQSQIFTSTNGGATWSQIAYTGMAPHVVYSFTVDPTKPSNIYAATDLGSYLSADGGQTWTGFAVGNATPTRFVFPRGDSSLILAATNGGPYRSVDGGVTWINTPIVGPSGNQQALAFAWSKDFWGVIFAAGTNGEVFRSLDDGQSWTWIGTPPSQDDINGIYDLAFNPITNTLYARDLFQKLWALPTGDIATITGTPLSPTNVASATLLISGSDVVAYKYKIDGGYYSSQEIPVATPITLTSLADGSHTVSVIGRDSVGNWQALESATMATWTVDIASPTGTISINDGALGTNSPAVTLNLTATDTVTGVIMMAFSNDGVTYTSWEDYNPASPSKTWTLPEGAGVKTVFVKFKDNFGNESISYSDTIILDITSPIPVIDYPRDLTTVTSVLAIQGTVSDPTPSSGVSKIEIAVSQSTQIGTYYLQPNKTEWSKTSPVYHVASLVGGDWGLGVGNVWTSEQSYTVTARATDNVGYTGSVSSTFTYLVQTSAYTTLTMDLSSQTILNKGGLVVTGKLSRLPEVNMDLRNLSISIDITSPTGTKIPVADAVTGVDGSYTFSFPDDNSVFTEKGTYALQVKFAQTGSLAASASDTKSVLVGATAGYAILVQGKLLGPNPEGLASHNKTTNRIYNTLGNRGFDDANIMYFNYTTPQEGIVIDAPPTKEGVESAIKAWAGGKMNAVPAPLYIIMVNHGDPNIFHIGDKAISPGELSSWLDVLETSLDQEAKQEKIIVVLGACYSGSFIPQISKLNTNRIIITSAAADEESYKGPLEGFVDSIRSGEYFIDSLFVQLGRGYSLKNSFEEATRETEEYTRKGGASANTPNPYFDAAMQHPLIDDNGDGRGSNVLALGQGDGQAGTGVFLGTGATYDTNAARVEITGVTETNYLNVSTSTALLWLKVSNPVNVSSAWAIIRPPTLDLSQNQTASSYQLDINLTPQQLSWNQSTGRYELTYNGFADPGMYEIFYYIIETGTPAVVSPLKRSFMYKNKDSNVAPSAPTLVKPAPDEVTRTTLIFQWNASIDTDPVTYNLVIAMDSAFTNVVYRKDGITSTISAVDARAGLKDLTWYYWRVEAVDGYTRNWSAWRKFKTDNTNGLPGILTGIVFSDRDYSLITAATILVTVNNNPVPVEYTADGSFVLSSLSGTATLEITAAGYEPLSVSDVALVAGDTTSVNLRMIPVANQKGDISGDGYVTIADAILALQVAVGRPPAITPNLENEVNGDGRIGMADVIYILQRVAGLR